uniref:Mpv17-like protein 2 n=1 Tax=Panagrellus redivivus TaxID=6233 RepID=A0A7E5A0X4_PANRE
MWQRAVAAWRTAFSGKYLLATDTVNLCLTYAAGDAITQKFEQWDNPNMQFNWSRSVRVGCLGLFHGPFMYYFYHWLDGTIKAGSTLALVAKKVAIDASIAPCFSSSFVIYNEIVTGGTFKEAFKHYRDKALQLHFVDVTTWPPAQVFNFWLLPHRYRVLYISIVELLYTFRISYVAHSHHTIPGAPTTNIKAL